MYIIIIYQFYSAKNDVPMSVFRPSNVRLRTLEGSQENLGGFSEEPWRVLRRTLEGSQKNLGGFSEEPWRVPGQTHHFKFL